jgi:predicted cupin superfamily sugar epimerase
MNDAIIEQYHLEAHPEGGYYREYYRSPLTVATPYGDRSAATSIWFYLPIDQRSHFHRLSSDEIWYWHKGGNAVLHCIAPDGTYSIHTIGEQALADSFVCVLAAGTWFAAEPQHGGVLVSAMVAPGFVFEDFELGSKRVLLEAFPQHQEIIDAFTSCE